MVLNEKGIIKQFDLVIYPIDIVAVIGDIEEEVNKLYTPSNDGYDWISMPPSNVDVRTYIVNNKETMKACVMLWSPSIEHCIGHAICHDSIHAAFEIFRYVGGIIDLEDQEPFCYLSGAIYRLFTGAYKEYKDFLEKKKSKSKTKKK